MFKTLFQRIARHKIISGLVILVIIFGSYYSYKKITGGETETRYVLGAVEKGTLITSIPGTGQISASSQVEIKAKASGEVVSLPTRAGQEVKSGTLLAQLDVSDAYKSVRDAQTALETAKLELEEAQKPASGLTLLQAENSLLQANQAQKTAEDNLAKSYEDGFNTVSNAFLELPNIMSGLRDILYSNSYNQNQNNMDYYADSAKYFDDKILTYRDDAKMAYERARAAYDANFSVYKTASRSSDTTTIESLLNQTYETVRLISEGVKSTNNLIQFYQDKFTSRGLTPQSLSTTQLTSLSSYSSKTNAHLSNLLTAKNNIPAYKDDIADAERTIKEKELSLDDIRAGTDELTIRAKRIAVQQKEDALASAHETLSDYSVRAPFDGLIAEVSIKKGDSLSSGSTVATIITKQSIAEITLNEVDVAKVKVGQKVNLTFDAIEDLNITGSVAEVDTLGTASSGVVSYTVQITFDTQDDRVKPGMSATANIILETKQDVLLVPSSAVKSSGDTYYVEILDSPSSADTASAGVLSTTLPRQQTVTIGSSNDTMTEIVDGLKEGDQIITRTISSSATVATPVTSNTRNTGMPGAGAIFGR